MNIKLKPIRQIALSMLTPNPLNDKFFDTPTGGETDKLFNNIKERGIIVPLIARKDGILLAGHRRLSIARQLNFETVPVQYVDQDLTEAEEKQFIIKDNALRRHLSHEERMALYRYLVPDFDDKIKNKRSKTMGVSTSELAEATGLNAHTINADINNQLMKNKRDQIQNREIDFADEREIFKFKKAVARILNVSILGSKKTNDAIIDIAENLLNRVRAAQVTIETRPEVKPKARRLK